jgi:hypothetical protein
MVGATSNEWCPTVWASVANMMIIPWPGMSLCPAISSTFAPDPSHGIASENHDWRSPCLVLHPTDAVLVANPTDPTLVEIDLEHVLG